ncbi:MAG: class I SAM-dependent methyltransferase [Acidobacteriota bacterium]
MGDFDRADATTYDRRIRGLVPGYELLHRLTADLLAGHLGRCAEVLVSGAGSGEGLVRLATAGPEWRLTALDPSPVMLAEAERKVLAAGFGDRVRFVESRLESWGADRTFDAAVSLLVAHFMPDDPQESGPRRAYTGAVARRLKPGGLYVSADFTADAAGRLRGAFRRWLSAQDADPESVLSRIDGRFSSITEARLAELCAGCGLGEPQLFFAALDVRGYAAIRDTSG